ncbi:lytic transglycosylase domain-containing protein [uncultured Selenomonas sp.]|uniref:lytic transglycosylase domain-containing protein n=1 Tax=uncultured Selenomonas sp. TaxID=159275 RepID=UPI002583A756|nr:lytic transglycosylase domain-containing protein [uncultured Selenomonas sp.]
MMDLSAIRQIQARIAEIEGQFNLPQAQLPGADFAARLHAEIDRSAAGAAEKAHTVQAAAPSVAVQETARAERTAPTDAAQPDLARTIHAAAQKYAVDPKLVSAVAEVESGGRQDAVSDAGAIGVMQLMPGTAAELGVNPYDMKSNVEGGTKYLSELLGTFGGDVRKAVAAYNAGASAVKAYGGVPPYAETQDYVNRVLDIYR